MDVATLADLPRETADHHGHCDGIAPTHDWWDWYAGAREQIAPTHDRWDRCAGAREQGSPRVQAGAVAGRHMAEVRHVVPR